MVFFFAGRNRCLDFIDLMLFISSFFFRSFGDATLLVLPGGVLAGLAEIVPAAGRKHQCRTGEQDDCFFMIIPPE